VHAALLRRFGRRPVLFALLLALLTAALVTVSANRAFADTSMCSGNAYSTCTNAGYTDHGYGANNGNMYWSEFSGHNCTNYVAYFEVQNGFSTKTAYNPGNAQYWGGYFSSRSFTVNGTPAVGAVAWWNASQGPADSSGHVAYVEAVHKDGNGNVTSIDISEDNWQFGPFDWKNIPVGSSNYPVGNSTTSGFIHLKDIVPLPPLLAKNVTGNPIAITNPDSSLTGFAHGTDGALWSTWQYGWDTGWHPFASLGGVFTGQPAITQDAKNGDAQAAFFIGTDGALWNSWQSSYGSTWHSWVSLGGSNLTGSPVLVTNPDGSLTAFARGTDGALYSAWQYGYASGWHAPVSLGSPGGGVTLTGQPIITQDTGNGSAQAAFMIGSDGALWNSWQSSYGSTWHSWVSLGGTNLTGNPVLVKNPDGSLTAFVRGSDGALYSAWQYGYDTGWHAPVSLGSPGGGVILVGQPVITQDTGNGSAQAAFMIGSDGALWNSWQSSYGSTWHSWVSLGGSNLTGNPVVVANPDASLTAFARGTDGALYSAWQYGYDTGWHAPVSLGSPGGGVILVGQVLITQDTKNGDAQAALVIGSDGALWNSWQSSYGSTWHSWVSLGGSLSP
jgi:surface antigen